MTITLFTMIRTYLFSVLVFLLISIGGFSQSIGPNLATRRKSDNLYGAEKVKISPKQLLILTKNNTEAYNEARAAKTYKNVGSVIGFTGGFLAGYGIVGYLTGESPTGPLVATGGLLIIGSIPFQIGYATHTKRAINIYNNDLKQIGQNKLEVKLCMALNKMKLNISF